MDAAGPKGTDYDELNERWENALTRCDAVEDQIMEAQATSMQGVAITKFGSLPITSLKRAISTSGTPRPPVILTMLGPTAGILVSMGT